MSASSERVLSAIGEEMARLKGRGEISENSDHVFLIKPKVRPPLGGAVEQSTRRSLITT